MSRERSSNKGRMCLIVVFSLLCGIGIATIGRDAIREMVSDVTEDIKTYKEGQRALRSKEGGAAAAAPPSGGCVRRHTQSRMAYESVGAWSAKLSTPGTTRTCAREAAMG